MKFEKCDWLVDSFNSLNFKNLAHGIIINGPKRGWKKITCKKNI